MGVDKNNIEELLEENVEKMLEDMLSETFNKEFENIESFDENMSIEEAQTQLEEVEQNEEQISEANIEPEVNNEKQESTEQKNINNKKAFNVKLETYEDEELSNVSTSSEVTFKAGEIKDKNQSENFKSYISPENIEYMDYYNDDDDNLEDAEDEQNEEQIKDLTPNKNDNISTEKHEEIKSEKYNYYSDLDVLDGMFKEIVIDETLPSGSGDLYYVQSQSSNSSKKSKKNRTKIEVIKANVVGIIIFCIIAIGVFVSFLNYEGLKISSSKTLVYELPTLSFSVFDETGTVPHNVKLNVSVGVASSDMKLVDSAECYNIVYDTVTNMDYQYFESPNAQYELKKDIKKSLDEKDKDNIDYRVYISGIDVGKANLIGTTVDTKSDNEQNKKESSENLLNSMRYNDDSND